MAPVFLLFFFVVMNMIDFICIPRHVQSFLSAGKQTESCINATKVWSCSRLLLHVLVLNYLQIFVFQRCLVPFCCPYVQMHKQYTDGSSLDVVFALAIIKINESVNLKFNSCLKSH